MTHEVFDDHTAQYKEKLPPNTWQVASKGLIASAVTESLSIQHLGGGGSEDQAVAARRGFVIGVCSQNSLPHRLCECFSVVSGGGIDYGGSSVVVS